MYVMKKLLVSCFFLFSVSFLSAQPPTGEANPGDNYGEMVGAGKYFNAKDLPGKLHQGPVEAKIRGKVLEVCPKKGCWVKLQLEDKSLAFVKMKDYGFFVPTTLEGKNVIIDGKIEMATTSVAELKHFAEDAKKSPEEINAISQPKNEIKVLATGIRVIK